MVNKAMILGRLGKDPELKYTHDGVAMTTFNVATNSWYTNKNGEKVTETEWHRIVAFQRLAENCVNFLKKGSLVFVEGSLQTKKWQDQNGNDRSVTSIRANHVTFLSKKSQENKAPENPDAQNFGDTNQNEILYKSYNDIPGMNPSENMDYPF